MKMALVLLSLLTGTYANASGCSISSWSGNFDVYQGSNIVKRFGNAADAINLKNQLVDAGACSLEKSCSIRAWNGVIDVYLDSYLDSNIILRNNSVEDAIKYREELISKGVCQLAQPYMKCSIRAWKGNFDVYHGPDFARRFNNVQQASAFHRSLITGKVCL